MSRMATSRDKLRATLSELRRELAGHETLDKETRRLLEQTARDLHSALDEERPEKPLAAKTYSGPLQQALARFEQSNPTLYKVVMNLVNALGEMGI
jgi:hypothetical protein